jgi:maltose alpha-D-glucosyltransferase / alpha-amylase
MIRLRKECPELGWGSFKIIGSGNKNVLAIRYDWRGNSILTIHNFHSKPVNIKVDVGVDEGNKLTNLLLGEHSQAGADGKHAIVLEGYAYRWYRVGGLRHILEREKY